jgi:acyl dehydratase
MCEFRFGTGEIRQWAEFSGDRNPIHFDPAHAQRIGAPGVVVHGMLVLLAVKNHAGQAMAAAADSSSGWWLFRSRLRHPVIAGDPVRIDTRPQGQGLAFTITAVGQERKIITGALVTHDAPGQDDSRWLRIELPGAAISERAAELGTAFPWITESWVILDALLFSEFLRTGMRGILAAHGMDLVSGTSAGSAFVVQTAHEVAFDRDVFSGAQPFDLGIVVEAPEPEYEAIEAGVYATSVLTARVRDRAVMRMKLTIAVMQAKPSYQQAKPSYQCV